MPMYTCPRYIPRQPAAASQVPNTPTPDLALAQLMSLLDPIIDATSVPQVPRQIRKAPRTVFRPKFDVQETATEYVLEGELPGLSDKSKLDIQFTGYKTLVVRGVLEKAAVATPKEEITPEETTPEETTPKEVAAPDSPRPRSLKPTVEDTQDELDTASTTSSGFEVILTPSSKKPSEKSPASASEKKPTVVEKGPAVNKPKTWVSERTFGPFQRSFSFPGLIDVENVSAGLEAGLLKIVVPKKTQSLHRKIVIA